MRPILYFDNAATTAVAPEVVSAMQPFWEQQYGNASSRFHAFGWAAEEAVHTARAQVASRLGALPQEIVFTSGASESLQLISMGWEQAGGKEVVTSQTEHSVVLDLARWAASRGKQVQVLPVDSEGNLSHAQDIVGKPDLFIFMWGNNEIGTCHDIPFWVRRLKSEFPGCWVACDATQAILKENIHFQETGLDFLVGSAHKFHGPKGVGFLCVRQGLDFYPWGKSQRQERGRRAGTVAVPLVVGLAAAMQLPSVNPAIADLRDQLENILLTEVSEAWVNGNRARRLPHISSITFPGIDGERLFQRLTRMAVSNGSACTSAEVLPSHVLKAIGLSDADAESTVRFSLSRYTTQADVLAACQHMLEVLPQLR